MVLSSGIPWADSAPGQGLSALAKVGGFSQADAGHGIFSLPPVFPLQLQEPPSPGSALKLSLHSLCPSCLPPYPAHPLPQPEGSSWPREKVLAGDFLTMWGFWLRPEGMSSPVPQDSQ